MQRVSSGPVQRPPQSPATVVDGRNSQQQNMHGRCKQRPTYRPVVVAAAKYASYWCASFAETSARKRILETCHGNCKRTSGKKTRPYRTRKRGTKFLHGRTAPARQRFRSPRLARAAQAREPRHLRRGGHVRGGPTQAAASPSVKILASRRLPGCFTAGESAAASRPLAGCAPPSSRLHLCLPRHEWDKACSLHQRDPHVRKERGRAGG